MIIPSLLLLAGFFVLIKGADLFVDGAAHLAKKMGVSTMAVGLTVVAFGSSAPELFVNLSAAANGYTDLALGNVIGSNIANILLVLGIAVLIRPITITGHAVWSAIPCSLLATLALWGLASDIYIDGAFFAMISRSDGLVLLSFFFVFTAYAASTALPLDGFPVAPPAPADKAAPVALKIAIGFSGLLFGGQWVVEGSVILADRLAIPSSVMGLTLTAIGTSLPELATSAMAAKRGEAEIAVGNVVGANIFNLLFVLGISAVIRPMPFGAAGHVDMGILTAAGLMLLVFMFSGRVRIMGRREGVMALILYGLYLGYLLFPAFFPDPSTISIL